MAAVNHHGGPLTGNRQRSDAFRCQTERMTQPLPSAEAFALASLVTPTEHGIASRVLAKTSGGNLTLFAFDVGQGLTEHTSPFEAFVLVLEGRFTVTIGGTTVVGLPGTIVGLPATVPHALEAMERSRMLLVMLRDQKTETQRPGLL